MVWRDYGRGWRGSGNGQFVRTVGMGWGSGNDGVARGMRGENCVARYW